MKNAFRAIRVLILLGTCAMASTLSAHELTISKTRFLLDQKPFPYTGVSFFNAIYCPAFNASSPERKQWMQKFQRYGVNVLRVWAQWDSKYGYLETDPACTLYNEDGSLRPETLVTLKAIIADADDLGMVVEVVLFSQESWHSGIKLGPAAADYAVSAITRELMPCRNVSFQVWNEFSERVIDHVKTIRSVDARRLISNSPGGSSHLGDPAQNDVLDFLTPHTSRQNAGDPWLVAPKEIEYLLARYQKPVVDDEPARNGTSSFGGPRESTTPYDHILQIEKVWELGGYVIYHHDMFQTGHGSPACPPNGIPDPEFSPYHRQVFEFLKYKERFMPPELTGVK